MKTTSYYVLIIFFCLISCEKQDENSAGEVEQYIQLLMTGSYQSMYLPEFKTLHIPELLKYRDSRERITNFPHNPISSMYVPECTLGVYVLWTIESIRLGEIREDRLFAGFPSLNPIIGSKNPENADPLTGDDPQQIAADAYYKWWYSPEDLSKKMHKDPLADTNYRWR